MISFELKHAAEKFRANDFGAKGSSSLLGNNFLYFVSNMNVYTSESISLFSDRLQ